jgi:predicted transcriptional regulator of viral defense system
LDWAAALSVEGQKSDIIRSIDFARKYGLPESSVKQALTRQEERGFVEHVSKGLYINKLAKDFNQRDLINVLRPSSYVSLESVLSESGIHSQVPLALTCVTTAPKWTIKTKSVHITFRTLKKDLFWGNKEKRTRYGTYKSAEPEKAFLDWVYFRLHDGLPLNLDEFEFGKLSRNRIIDYAKKYPSTVLKNLYPLLVEKSFAA